MAAAALSYSAPVFIRLESSTLYFRDGHYPGFPCGMACAPSLIRPRPEVRRTSASFPQTQSTSSKLPRKSQALQTALVLLSALQGTCCPYDLVHAPLSVRSQGQRRRLVGIRDLHSARSSCRCDRPSGSCSCRRDVPISMSFVHGSCPLVEYRDVARLAS